MRTTFLPFLIMLLFSNAIALLSLPLANTMPLQAQSSSPTYWKSFYFYGLIDSNPQGRLNVVIDVFWSGNDGNPNYDWYFFRVNIQSVPGKVAYVAYGSDWETADHDAYHTLDSLDAGKTNWFVDYDPTTTIVSYSSASYTVTVSLEAEEFPALTPGVAISLTYTYDIPWIAVRDLSDFSAYRIEWIHDFNEQNDDPLYGPSSNTHLAKPGFVVLAKNVTICDGGLRYCWIGTYAHVIASYKVTFGHRVWWGWEYKTFTSQTIYIYPSIGRGYTW